MPEDDGQSRFVQFRTTQNGHLIFRIPCPPFGVSWGFHWGCAATWHLLLPSPPSLPPSPSTCTDFKHTPYEHICRLISTADCFLGNQPVIRCLLWVPASGTHPVLLPCPSFPVVGFSHWSVLAWLSQLICCVLFSPSFLVSPFQACITSFPFRSLFYLRRQLENLHFTP